MNSYVDAAGIYTRTVGEQMVQFSRTTLIPNGAKTEDMSVAGHSLGAHIGGYFGNGTFPPIRCIFGLDPAGPGFTFPYDVGPANRLDPGDARFVQVLHTSGILGTTSNIGHADHRANDGENQPGCGIDAVCNHSRAEEIFRYALNNGNVFLGVQCAGLNGSLISNLLLKIASVLSQKMCYPTLYDVFGIHTSRYNGQFKFDTTSQPPFAMGTAVVPTH